MSGRGLSVAMVAELDKLQNRVSHMAEVYFDDESVYLTDLYTNVSWGGNTYLAVGDFAGFDGVEESVDSIIQQATVSLSGVQSDWMSRVLSKQYLNRRIVVRKATHDSAWQVVVDPGTLFDGFMKRPRWSEDPDKGTCTIMIECAHNAADFDNATGRRTNDQLHRLLFPTDGFFKYAAQADRQLIWGPGGTGATPVTAPAIFSDYNSPI